MLMTMPMLADSALVIFLCIVSSASLCFSFTPSPLLGIPQRGQQRQQTYATTITTTPPTTTTDDAASSAALQAAPSSSSSIAAPPSLPHLYPLFSATLAANGYTTPTPIQHSSAPLAKAGDSLLLIAATGSGKTLAYLLPALSRACGLDGVTGSSGGDDDRNHRPQQQTQQQTQRRRKTTLIIAPTRELAAQLARDASLLLPELGDDDETSTIMQPNVLLAVRGIPPPTPTQINSAAVLVGTPNELYAVLTRIRGAQSFVAGNTLSALILDEVDVLLPPAAKTLRTAFDASSTKSASHERKNLEQRRKLRAAQKRGVEFHGGADIRGKSSINSMDLSDARNSQELTPTEQVLRVIAAAKHVGRRDGDDREGGPALQVLAGSATASRAALERLNKALRWAALEGNVIGGDVLEGVWKGRVKVCRPVAPVDGDAANGDDEGRPTEGTSTRAIRAVAVPSAVSHKYVAMTKEAVADADAVLVNVAHVARELRPQTSLVFVCGEFSRSLAKEKKREAHDITGNTSQSRRNAKRRSVFMERQRSRVGGEKKSVGPAPLSVKRACSVLQSLGLDAQPMHVVLGLEPNAAEDNGEARVPFETDGKEGRDKPGADEVELPPVLVTFEGSARGLHFEGVDIVFVVGRPTSAASYLHLAGRVGRAVAATAGEDVAAAGAGEVQVRPGTIVSFCSAGRVGELEKWMGQVGATGLEEMVL